MERRKKIILTGVSPDIGNRGVRALLSGSLKIILHTFPDAEVALLDYAKQRQTFEFTLDGQTHVIDTIDMRYSKKLYLRNNIAVLLGGALLWRVLPFGPLRRLICAGLPRLKEIAEADLTLSMSGGDSFSDVYGLHRFIFTVLPQLLLIVMGKRRVMLPQTLGPFKGPLCRRLARFILLHSDRVWTRDTASKSEVTQLFKDGSINSRLQVSYDVAFVVEPRKPAGFTVPELLGEQRQRPVVGVNVSGLLYRGGYTRDDQFGLGLDYPRFVRRLVGWFLEHNAVVLLIPHVFDVRLNVESDTAGCREVYEHFRHQYPGSLLFWEEDYDEAELKYLIGLCDFFVGSRMHACIAALSQSVPAVAVAYSRKFRGVFETIGVEDLVADPRTVSEDEVLGIIARAMSDREAIAARLRETMPEIQRRTMGVLRGLVI